MIERWASYREFWFDQDRDTIHTSDRYQLEQIASYMRNNPSLEIGLDGSSVSGSAARRNQNLSENRVAAVRNGLINAGVQANRISNASIANQDNRREDRVAVLLRTKEGYSESNTAYADRNGSEASRGIVDEWTTYHTFSFDADQTSIHSADRERMAEIVSFMERNPGMRLGISSSRQASDRDLATQRSNKLRDALVDAGVARSRISIGEFGDERNTRSGRLEVLVMTDRTASRER